jgi:hypothetical protein
LPFIQLYTHIIFKTTLGGCFKIQIIPAAG